MNAEAPWVPGGYCPEAFSDNGKGEIIEWGLHVGVERHKLYLERFDIVESNGD